MIYHETLVIPIFLGLITLLKSLSKSVTPKLFLLLVKNSLMIKIRQFITRGSTHLIVLSHRPARQKLRDLKVTTTHFFSSIFRRYLEARLWIRTSIALGLLLLTASSSYVFIALLIIPQPLLNWVKKQTINTLNKLGITQAINAIWRFLVPARLQHRWHIYRKWTLGRKQILTARQLHSRFLSERKSDIRS